MARQRARQTATLIFGVFRQLGLMLAMLVAVTAAYAAPIKYYEAQVAVKSQSTEDRNRAASIGLKHVLVRVSGSTNVTGSPAMLRTLGGASRFIEQFDYSTAAANEDGNRYLLNMTFPSSIVERLLLEADLPFWPTNRPNVLVWLVVDEPAQGKRLLNDPNHGVVASLQAAALARGVPLLLPLLDFDDQLAIEPQQVWDRKQAAVQNASVRYGVDTILVGRLAQSSRGTWLTTWAFFHQGEQKVYDARSDTINEATAAGIAPLANHLASLYSVRPNNSSEVQPRFYAVVKDVDAFGDFDAMSNYLESLALVSKFELLRVQGAEVSIMLELSGSLLQLHNTFALDGVIQAEELKDETTTRAVSLGTPLEPLHFFWRGR